MLEQAEQKWETDKIIAPVRGTILDRNDKVLAEEGTAYTVTLNPKMIDSLHASDDIARGLADILKESDITKATLENKIREIATRKKPMAVISLSMSRFATKVGKLIRKKRIRFEISSRPCKRD